jgi:hypothetical protein
VDDGSVKTGDTACLPVFGGGLTWGSALVRWQRRNLPGPHFRVQPSLGSLLQEDSFRGVFG